MQIRRPPRIGRTRPSPFAIILGIVTGLGAVLFRARIGLIHNVAFRGRAEMVRKRQSRRKTMSFNRRVVTFAGVLAFAASSRSSRLFAQSNDEAAVLAAVEALNRAMLAADRAQLEALVADQLSYGHSSGTIQTKTQFVDVIANKQTIYKSIVLDRADDRARRQRRDRAPCRGGRGQGRRQIGGRQRSAFCRSGSSHDGRWKLLARQAFKS